MSHLIACKDNQLLFSTTIYAENEPLYDAPLELFWSPKGLIIPNASTALYWAAVQRDPDALRHIDIAEIEFERSGMLMAGGFFWVIGRDSESNALRLSRPHPAGSSISWAYSDVDIDSEYSGNFLRGLLAGCQSLEQLLDVLKAKVSSFSPRGYAIYDIPTLQRWCAACAGEAGPIAYADFLASEMPAVAEAATPATPAVTLPVMGKRPGLAKNTTGGAELP